MLRFLISFFFLFYYLNLILCDIEYTNFELNNYMLDEYDDDSQELKILDQSENTCFFFMIQNYNHKISLN